MGLAAGCMNCSISHKRSTQSLGTNPAVLRLLNNSGETWTSSPTRIVAHADTPTRISLTYLLGCLSPFLGELAKTLRRWRSSDSTGQLDRRLLARRQAGAHTRSTAAWPTSRATHLRYHCGASTSSRRSWILAWPRGASAPDLVECTRLQTVPPRGFGLKPSTTRPVSWQRAWALAAAWREQLSKGDAGAGRGGVGEWVG